jgi:L-lactate dehydrogenase
MQPLRRDAVLLLVANPVDVLTCFAQEIAGLPREQVIGSGTFLDSVRLRGFLAEEIEVRPFQTAAAITNGAGGGEFD